MTNSETSGVELPDMDLLKKFDVPAPLKPRRLGAN